MENLNFENRVQNKCFWKAFHLILMHFIHKIQCFEESLHKIALFFKNLFFPEFRSIKHVSWPIEIAIKILVSLCLFDRCLIGVGSVEAFSIDRTYFSINQNSYWEFFKIFSFHVIKHYFKNFQNSFSLIRSVKASNQVFLSFSPQSFARFLSSKAGKTLLPLLFHIFSVLMHFCHAVGDIFEPKRIWDFCWFKPFLSKLINEFLLWDAINMILVV